MITPSITNIEYFIPDEDYSVTMLLNNKNNDFINKIIAKTGIDKKYRARINQNASDLAITCVKKLINQHDQNLKDFDFVIYCNQTPNFLLPMSSSIIQKEIFKRTDIGFIDISSGCSGYVYSLNLAFSLLKSNSHNKILLITSDTYSKIIEENDTTNLCIFGDGASASIIENIDIKEHNNYRFELGCDGNGVEDLYLPNSGVLSNNKKRNDKFLIMNGANVFSFAINEIPKNIIKCLDSNNLKISDIDYFILHQANKFILETIRDKLKIPDNKFIIDLRYGNTTSSTIPIAINNLIRENSVKNYSKVLICGFGVGLSWGSTIIDLNPKLIDSIKCR